VIQAGIVTSDCAISNMKTGEAVPAADALMDDETFAGFYQRTARPLWAYLARVLGNPTLADDLLQETFLRFLCNARWQDGEAACRSYLFRVATNLMRDHWRRPATTPLEEVPESALPSVNLPDERIDSQAVLGPAFARMRPRERQLLWLAYAEGATHGEIAKITGLGAASIRILLFRARHKIARLLRQQMPPERRDR
jgi:RNA polymerase sigma-70 factor (ECF subfamily)